ncbi:alpha/beta fold hydrolase [Alicyclobacillus dauci]|uniref:alpha/beta fold hydrolase n=1 Tax=Alicyclobacillus dauci TaxID=1475485 RepID=UPI0038992E1F
MRRLPYIKVPTLIVWGSEDKVNPMSMGEQMHSLIPDSEFVALPFGHYVASQAPEPFNHEVLNFLQKHSIRR